MTDPDAEQEAQRVKAVAETKYKNSNMKSALKHLCPDMEGISSMLTLQAASEPNATPDWYKILQVEPFSHINSIKKQYRKLALILHPDKSVVLMVMVKVRKRKTCWRLR
ncbi:hypothetical protein like AT2G35540 [Hibiscus trionum]|uniref:J domain-containing protein n=1 Tax=Hibiscus trionum TaxID=183268 RepID=A0A9W7II69_HIBTR|nr:hypothetical protein like AT2G35540 [Hibiscus trionum]